MQRKSPDEPVGVTTSMGMARTLAGLLAGGGVVRGGGKAQAPLSAPTGRASSLTRRPLESLQGPVKADLVGSPQAPPPPSRLHCTRALHPNGCAISTPSYRCPRQSPPQAASTPLPHRLVRSSSRAVDRTNPGITVLLHKSSCTYHSAICASTYHSALSTRPRGPGLEPHECPRRYKSVQPMALKLGNWPEPRAVTWGLIIIDKRRLGLKVPHDPGDYSFVA